MFSNSCSCHRITSKYLYFNEKPVPKGEDKHKGWAEKYNGAAEGDARKNIVKEYAAWVAEPEGE